MVGSRGYPYTFFTTIRPPRALMTLRLIRPRVRREQHCIAIGVLHHRKIHAERGAIRLSKTLVAVVHHFCVLCFQRGPSAQVKLQEHGILFALSDLPSLQLSPE